MGVEDTAGRLQQIMEQRHTPLHAVAEPPLSGKGESKMT